MPPQSISLTPVSPRHPPSYTTPPSHHINSPASSFKNPWPSFQRKSPLDAAKTRWFSSSSKNFVPVPSNISTIIPINKPDFGSDRKGLKATWIGHASFLVETSDGIVILLDPVWSHKVGPYGVVGPVRFSRPPCSIDEIPHVDAVLISHDHYDHLDSWTLSEILKKQKGDLHFLCALGVKSELLHLGVGIKESQVTQLDWWDGIRLSKENGAGVNSVDLICTPAQHSSGRAPWNFSASLWCSWVIRESSSTSSPSPSSLDTNESPTSKSLYFAGDTGFCSVDSDDQVSHHAAPHPPCPAFEEIGTLYGPFDLALLPIGCFQPRSFMSGVHSSPHDSVAIHKAIKSKRSIGMHYGTFRGSISAHYEPVTEPVERWRQAVEKEGLEWGVDADVCSIGDTVVV
ncbi:Metallo-hydrolase/oxidoreductase [Aaosphaeria arxii CBS 175.79]|uniref:Metallo-hydrolase/oxidoreductase n=1 Tax=Aaosphaeria arxii CBS 175.79 TaxID=1450172 RepID=A0A6A5XAM7_9PLEO|nr:Metallo-hydrolase/oxidoreductase [Aaosphaeria arxii CBS 175.79]KAF2009837.1 Metallo-hydrolase/oxidoreductase [Aaosphaeria arxii CBS 175.79]